MTKAFMAMTEIVQGTFDPVDGFNTFDIDNSKLINASPDPTINNLINLIVTDSTLQNSKKLFF